MGLSDLTTTAVEIARERAVESGRPDGLFEDPLAAAFVAAADGEEPVRPLGERVPVMRGYVALRTRVFDDALLAACRDGCRQVVLLGSGLDTRAYRLAWPSGTTLFELDLPEVIALKEQVLAVRAPTRRCARVVVDADLRDDWGASLLSHGFDGAVPTAWLAEGLLMYLSTSDNDRLLAEVTRLSAPASVLLVEHVPAAGARPTDVERGGHLLGDEGASWRSTHDDPARWLAAHGWIAHVIDTAAVAEAARRPVPPVLDVEAVGDARAWLLHASLSS